MMLALNRVLFYKVAHQSEHGLIAVEADSLIRIEDSVVVLEGIALFVLQEDAGHMACGQRLVIAVGCQVATMQGLEVMLLRIDLLKE